MEIILLHGENRISRDYVVTEVTSLAVKRKDERGKRRRPREAGTWRRANRLLWGLASSHYELLFSLIGFQFVLVADALQKAGNFSF